MDERVGSEIDRADNERMADIAAAISSRLIERRGEIAERWSTAQRARLSLEASDAFPPPDVLKYLPGTIADIARLLRHPDPRLAMQDTALARKCVELGALHFDRAASVSQILREQALLFDLLIDEVRIAAGGLPGTVDADLLAGLIGRVARANGALQDATIESFVTRHAGQARLQTERLRSLNGFLGHELRTPLQSAQLNLEMYRMGHPSSGDAADQLETVQNSLQRVVHLLNGLDGMVMDLPARGERSPRESLDIGAVVDDIVDSLGQSLHRHGVQFERDADLGSLNADRSKLDLVLSNLIGNAIKYSDPHKPERYVAVRRRHAPTDDMVAVAVVDNGLGIARAAQADVFQLRLRAHAERDAELAVSGEGFGLYLVAEAIADLDGQLTLDSQPGEGSSFTVCVPRHR